MIEVGREQLLDFAEVAKKLPRRKNGKAYHVNTIGRWATHGLRGVILETIPVGATLHTTERCLQDFCERLKLTIRRRDLRTNNPPRHKQVQTAKNFLITEGFSGVQNQAVGQT